MLILRSFHSVNFLRIYINLPGSEVHPYLSSKVTRLFFASFRETREQFPFLSITRDLRRGWFIVPFVGTAKHFRIPLSFVLQGRRARIRCEYARKKDGQGVRILTHERESRDIHRWYPPSENYPSYLGITNAVLQVCCRWSLAVSYFSCFRVTSCACPLHGYGRSRCVYWDCVVEEKNKLGLLVSFDRLLNSWDFELFLRTLYFRK